MRPGGRNAAHSTPLWCSRGICQVCAPIIAEIAPPDGRVRWAPPASCQIHAAGDWRSGVARRASRIVGDIHYLSDPCHLQQVADQLRG